MIYYCIFQVANEPDIILLNEVIPKAQVMPLCPSLIAIPNYAVFSNFDPTWALLASVASLFLCLINYMLQMSLYFQ